MFIFYFKIFYFIYFLFYLFLNFDFKKRYYKNIIRTILLVLKRISKLKKLIVPKPLRFYIIKLSINMLIEMKQEKFFSHKKRRKRSRDDGRDDPYNDMRDY